MWAGAFKNWIGNERGWHGEPQAPAYALQGVEGTAVGRLQALSPQTGLPLESRIAQEIDFTGGMLDITA